MHSISVDDFEGDFEEPFAGVSQELCQSGFFNQVSQCYSSLSEHVSTGRKADFDEIMLEFQ